jgi:small subunit ribosomal protein S20
VPNTSSAKKRMKQAASRNARNRVARSTLRTAIKKVRTATPDLAESAYRAAERLLDRAARKGLLHKNAAARSKRRLKRVVAHGS